MAALRRAFQDLNFIISKDSALLRRCVQESRIPRCAGHNRSLSQVVQEVQTLSPAVRYLVGTHKIQDTAVIRASGPKSRLLKGDILQYLAGLTADVPVSTKPSRVPKPTKSHKSPAPVTCAQYTDIAVPSEEREAAAGLVRAKREVPHVYLSVDCEVPSWLLGKGEDVARAHVLKCIAQTVRDDPGVSVVWDGSAPQSVSRPSVAIGTTTRGAESITPNVLPVETITMMSLRDLAATIATGGASSSTSASISVTYCHDSGTTGQTGILLPGQTLALHVIGQQHRGASIVTVCVTGDGRVLELETLARWLSLLVENCSRTV